MAEDEQISYRINDDDEQVRLEQARLLTLARVTDTFTRETLRELGISPGWRCCDVGAGAGTVAAWMAEQVGPAGAVTSLDVDTRFHVGAVPNLDVRTVDVTAAPIGAAEYDLVHARGVLQHLVQREAVLDKMIAAAKPGGWIVVTDSDWIAFDAQPVPEPFATLSNVVRAHGAAAHGHDAMWGRLLLGAFAQRGLTDIDGQGRVWTMHGGTDSAEWYVGAIDRALPVLPAEIFPDGFDPKAAIAHARQPDFAILSPISITVCGRRPA